MVKRRRETDFNGANTETADNRTVFVDTSLDTHLAVTVSNSDTVSDFKRKTVLEHMRCFPEIGEIHIHSLKVKRRAVFYHLPETMLVRSALQAGNSSWFLSADASITPVRQLNQNSLQLDPSYGVKMDSKNIDDNNCIDLLPVVNVLQTLPMPWPDGVSEKNLASEMIPACEIDKSLEKATEIPSNSYSEEDCIGIDESRAKKKRKISHTEDLCCDPSLKDTSALSHLSGNDISLPETVGSGNSTVDAVKEATGNIIPYQQNEKPNTSNATDEVSGSRNDQCDIENEVGLEGKSAPDTAEESNLGSIMDSQNILDSDTRKENTLLESTVPEDLMASKLDELGQDVTIEHSGGVSVRAPDSSGAMEDDVSSDGSQANKMKAQQIQDTTDMEQTAKDDSIKPCTETHEVDKMEEEKGSSLNCDREILTPLNSKDSDHADSDLVPNEASFLSHVCHANVIVEPDFSGAMGDVSSDESKKKKKKAQKMAKHIQDTTDMEQITIDDSIRPCTESDKSDKNEEEKGLSLNCDREIITPLEGNASDCPDPDLVPKEASLAPHVCHANAIVELDSSGLIGDVSSDGSKKKKKKADKTGEQIQDTTDMEQTAKDDSIQPCTETHKADDEEEEKGLSLNCDREIITPSNSKASDHPDPDLVPKEANLLARVCHVNAIVEPDSSGAMGDVSSDGSRKKKKKAHKTAKQIQDTTDMEQITNDDSIQPCTESHKADEKEEEKGLSVNCDLEITTPLNSKASDCAGPDLVPKEACFSPRVLHANAIVEPDSSGAMGDVYSDRNKRMKKRSQKAAKKPRDTTDMEQTTKDDSTKPCTEIHKVDKSEEEKGLSINLDHETVMPSNSKALDYADQDLAPEESTFSTQFGDANATVQPEISSGGRKKKSKRKGKKETKSANIDIEMSGIEQTDNGGIGSSELLGPPTDPIPEETHKEESILYHKEMDVNTALLDSSTQDANEEVKGADKKEAEFFISTQTKQALNGVDTGNKTVEEKTQLSAAHAHFPAVVEFTDVEKDIKTSEGKIEKSKRRKKRKHAESDVQENLPSKDQKVGIEALTTEENLNGFVNSEQKGGHETSLQVLSSKGEEQLEEIHTAPVITDDPAKTSEKGGVGINFKEYFLPGRNKEITDSGNKTEEMRTSTNVRDDVLPSVGVSTDLHNSIKKTKSKRSEKKTRVTKDSGSRQGDSAQNRAFDEVISKSFKRSSKSRVNEKNPSLDKSSSKKTETFHERRGNKRLHSSLNVTDKLVMKTSKKKSLLTIPGAIFQDNSGESSADDNGTVHLKSSIASPPDSSSESDNAIEKGSNDVEGRSTGRKSISEVDISASKSMTMDMILRSSKRFKKAKLSAYDNGYDDSENLEEVQEEGKAADIGLSK